MPRILFLSRVQMESLLEMKEVLGHVEEALRLLAQSARGEIKSSFSPMSVFHTITPNADVDYRAGGFATVPTLCATIGYGYGDNPMKHGISGLSAIGILSNQETGEPVAIMDAAYLSNKRTGAAAAVASKYLARGNSRRLGFIGTGNLARQMLEAHLEQYGSVGEVRAWSRNQPMRERFAAEMRERTGVDVRTVEQPRAAVEGADILYCSSRSTEPRVFNDWIAPGTHINAFGADGPGKQELDVAILQRAKIVVDSLVQVRIGGEIHKALADGSLTEASVHAEFWEVVGGEKPGRENDEEVTVMDSTGLAAWDVLAFHAAYERAAERGVGTWLDW